MTPDPEHRSSVRAHALRSVDGSAQKTYPTSLAAVGERGGESKKHPHRLPLPPSTARPERKVCNSTAARAGQTNV